MTDEIGAAEISEYLADHSDFDLEQQVYNMLRSRGVDARHGGGYVDPLSEKYRQFDIRASKNWGGQTTIRMAIECKSLSVDFPLVVLRVPRPQDESFHELLQGPGMINGVTHSGASSLKCTHPSGPYRVDEPVGKSATQIGFEKGQKPKEGQKRKLVGSDRDTFDKWSQALASAAYLFEEAIRDHMARRTWFTFVMPILVVPNSTLWVEDYSAAGARAGQPQRVDETTLFVDRKYQVALGGGVAAYIGHLHIFTVAGFESWVAEITNQSSSRFWFMVFEETLRGTLMGGRR